MLPKILLSIFTSQLLLASIVPHSVSARQDTPLAPEGCAQHQARFAGLLGKAPEEVRAALQAMPGINTVRMGGPTTPMTKDYRLDRATGLIEGGVVTRITCG